MIGLLSRVEDMECHLVKGHLVCDLLSYFFLLFKLKTSNLRHTILFAVITEHHFLN